MATKVTRGQVADYVAAALPERRAEAVAAAAAWLVDTGRGRQAGYLARDVAAELARRGYVLVRVTTARPLGEAARAEVEEFVRSATGARELEVETLEDPEVVGGVRIETPTGVLDGTVKTRLAKFVQGFTR